MRTVPATNFMGTVAANVDNGKMSDKDFRQFIRDTLPIIQYEGADKKTGGCGGDGSDYSCQPGGGQVESQSEKYGG